MNEDRIKKLDAFFEAFSIIAEGNYVYVCDMKEDYSRWSKSAVDYFDLPDKYMYHAGDIWKEHVHPDDQESYIKSIENIFAGGESGHDMRYRARARDGSYAICTCRGIVLRDEFGNPEYFAGAIKNHGMLSYIDTVTGLRSLYGFLDDINSICWKKENNALLLIGLSSFSTINDIYGFSFGNNVMRQLGSKLYEKFADSGVLYRMDGTKFALITNELSVKKIEKIYEELKEELTHTFYVDQTKVILSLNAGVVVVDNFEIKNETVYSCLKYAYYQSKNRRLGELVIFEDGLSDDNRQYVEKLNTIRSSITENCSGFYLCYQPIINNETEKLEGMEALIRWKNDGYGIVPPAQFIPILEQDPIFPELGKWILRQAMLDGKRFLEKCPDFTLNINISYAQLEKSSFASEVFEVLEETGYPPENLCLELTERCRLLDMSLLKNLFRIFKQKGIKIALDDFGTGFSSLGVLRELSIDTIKIDRDFVRNIEKSQSDQNTVKFIADLAGAFSTNVCVEGVENAGIKDFLSRYNVKSLQGYYFSEPLSIDMLTEKYSYCV